MIICVFISEKKTRSKMVPSQIPVNGTEIDWTQNWINSHNSFHFLLMS